MTDLPPGVTYRQLDHWTRLGLLTPANGAPGSGKPRDWPERELRVAGLIGELRDIGFELTVAAEIARAFADGQFACVIGQYVLMRVEPAGTIQKRQET